MEFTRCIGGNIESFRFQTVDEDITVNMDMTRNYENWEQEKPVNGNQTHWNTSRNNNNLKFKTKVHHVILDDIQHGNIIFTLLHS